MALVSGLANESLLVRKSVSSNLTVVNIFLLFKGSRWFPDVVPNVVDLYSSLTNDIECEIIVVASIRHWDIDRGSPAMQLEKWLSFP